MENSSKSPEIDADYKGRPQLSPDYYLEKMSEAYSKGKLDEYYASEKEKLEYSLSFASAGDSDVLRQEIILLDESYKTVKEQKKDDSSKNVVSLLFALLLVFVLSFLIYDNYKKKQIIDAQNGIIKEKIQQISEADISYKSKISDMNESKEKLLGMLNEEKENKNKAESENKTLLEEKTKMSAEIESLSSEKERMKKTISGLQTDLQSYKTSKEELSKNNAELASANASLKTENQSLKNKNQTLSSELSSIKIKQDQNEKQIKDLSAANEQNQKKLAAKDSEIAVQKKNAQTAENKNKALMEDIKKLSDDNTRLLKLNTQYFQEKRELQKKCSASK